MTVKYGVRIKINVSMIMKAWLFSGKKGKYLDATVFLTPHEEGQYGDHGMVTQDVPQLVSQADPTITKGPILGNCTVFWSEGVAVNAPTQVAAPVAPVAPSAPQAPMVAPAPSAELDDIPF